MAEYRRMVMVMGVPLDNLDQDEAAARIARFVESGAGRFVVTANINFLSRAAVDPEFMEIVRLADMITADGMPLVWAARLLGTPVKGRVTGSDLVPALLGEAEARGWRVYFLGGTPEVGAEAMRRIAAAHPDLAAGHYSPPFDPLLEMNNELILERIRAFSPQLLFVSLGAGKAEKWMRMNQGRLPGMVSMGVGATIDFLAGRVRRSPRLLQRAGLEWLWRLAMEPGRMWRRYVVDGAVFVAGFARQFAGHWANRLAHAVRRPREDARLSLDESASAQCRLLEIGGRLNREAVSGLHHTAGALLGRGSLCLDLSRAGFLDSGAMGALVDLEKTARENGSRLYLLSPGGVVRRLLAQTRLDEFLDLRRGLEDVEAENRVAPHPFLTGVQAEADGVVRLVLHGRLDAANQAEFGAILEDHTEPGRVVVLDFTRVVLADSSALGVIIRAARRLGETGGALRVEGVTGAVARVFSIMRLDRYLGGGRVTDPQSGVSGSA